MQSHEQKIIIEKYNRQFKDCEENLKREFKKLEHSKVLRYTGEFRKPHTDPGQVGCSEET